jgi:CBS-domain-containing membrane protein
MQRHSYWPVHHHWKRILTVSVGITLALGLAGVLAKFIHHPLLIAPLGASSLLLFGFPDSAFSQPRNFIGGNFICALIGLTFIHVIGDYWWTVALATSVATAAMMITDTLHPPAASSPMIICTLHAGWSFLLFPNFCGNVIVLSIALLYHYFTRKERYPHYWI